MNQEQQLAILGIAMHAAFADGANDEREREQIRRLAESLGEEAGLPDLPALYRRILLKQLRLQDAAAALSEPEHRHLAYEMAVCVCDADGHLKAPEREFLSGLAQLLALDVKTTAAVEQEADSLAELVETAAPATAATAASRPAAPAATGASPAAAELDRSILNYAILNGALELLPQSWASMAIIPLQIKMVYGIGKAHGYELDQSHIREFLATLGVGLTSQYLEQFGRKLLGGLLGKAAGKMAGQFGRAATGVAFSFATTYALGQVARRYYAGGRQMNTALLQETFQGLLGPAKQMQAQYLPQIQQKAGSLDMGQIMSLVRS